MRVFSKLKINEMFRQAKRPLACLLVLCMILTFMPNAPKLGLVDEVFAGNIDSDTEISSANNTWGNTSVADNVTITIPSTETLTVEGQLSLGANVTIDGGGTIIVTHNNYIKLTGNVTIRNVTIEGDGETSDSPLIADESEELTGTNIILESVTIQNAKLAGNSDYASAFHFNYAADKAHNLYLRGDTTIINNAGGKVGAIGCQYGLTYASGDAGSGNTQSNKIYIEDNVIIKNNTNDNGKDANIKSFRSDLIEVSGDLSETAEIGVTAPGANPSATPDYDNYSFGIKGSGCNNSNAEICSAFFMDDFHGYGVTVAGTTIKPAKKYKMTVTKTGDGDLEATDIRGRNIIKNTNAASYDVYEVPGYEVSLKYKPNENNFVKGVTVSGVYSLGSTLTHDATVDRYRTITFAAVNGGTHAVAFEQAITAIDFGTSVIKPYGYLLVGDSLSARTIDSSTPLGAGINITSIKWHHGSNEMEATESFTEGESYKLVITLEATGGSQFSTDGVCVTAVEADDTKTPTDDYHLTVEIEKTAAKMPIEVAEARHYVTFTAITSGNAFYNAAAHGPVIKMEDSSGSIDLGNSCVTVTAVGSSNPLENVTLSSNQVTGGYEFVVNGPVNAGSYVASLEIANVKYEGTKKYTDIPFTISKAAVTPQSLSFTDLATKYYDGTDDVTDGAVKINFSGVIPVDAATLTYTATYKYSTADAGSSKTINATGITLTGDAANNYECSTTSCDAAVSSDLPKSRILKVTPQAVLPYAYSFTSVSSIGTKISDIGFNGLLNSSTNWFTNPFATGDNMKVPGSIQVVSPATINEAAGTATALDPDTVVGRNAEYSWMFTPTDGTNYYTTFGTVIFWPTEPIKVVTLSGITIPEKAAVNNTTITGITAKCGPTESSRIDITSITWAESKKDGSDSRSFAYGDTFRYNRKYVLTIGMAPADGDRFADQLTVSISGSAVALEQVSKTAIAATYRATFETGYGLLNDAYFRLTPAAYYYDGTEHKITFSAITLTAIDTINDALLKFQTKLSSGSYEEGVLKGYTDVIPNGEVNVRVGHPDYRTGANNEWLTLDSSTITVSPKAITSVTISEVKPRPYDGTDVVEVVLTSTDIVSGDAGRVTFSAIATVSNPNYTTGNVTVNATATAMGGDRAFNYTFTPGMTASLVTSGIIQKVTPTYAGIGVTWTAVTTANPQYNQLNVQPQGFKNEYITPGQDDVTGTIVSYTDSTFSTTVSAAQLNTAIVKRHEYYWRFVPTGAAAANYNVVEGGPVKYWPGTPITTATLTGIALPVATNAPTAQEAIGLALNDTTTDITVTAISWTEKAPTELADKVSDRALNPATDKFYYNRYHVLTVTLQSQNNQDDFETENPIFSGKIDIGGPLYDCTTEFVTTSTQTGDKAYTAILTCTFNDRKTDKGVLNNSNLDVRDFASYERDGTLAHNDLRGEGTFLTYVYTGRSVTPYPTAVALQEDKLTVLKYATKEPNSSYTSFGEEVPRYTDVMKDGNPRFIKIQLTHPDYTDTVEKEASLLIGPCFVRPEGIDYVGKAYDGTKDISGAKIIWVPTSTQTTTYDGILTNAIDESLISYSAKFEFDGENAAPAKSVIVTDVDLTSDNFKPVIADVDGKGITKTGEKAFRYDSANHVAIPIWKASVTPKTGSILTKPVGSGLTLSAIQADYMITNSNASTGAVMVNAGKPSLDVYGKLGLATTNGSRFLTADELATMAAIQDKYYTWRFEPYSEYSVNYAITTGSQIIWPKPNTPSYGGGGGGGGGAAPVVTPTAVKTTSQSGVIATSTAVSTQIHVYLLSNGSIVTDKYFLAHATGTAVDRAVSAMPDGNVVVDSNGNIVIKAIIEGGTVKAYLKGDNYLTIQKRKIDFIDVPGHWFEPYVDFCSARDLMQGTGEDKFSPNDTLTRAMAATILYRLEGSQALNSSNTRRFADVEDGKWYTDGIAWAGGTGIVNGIGVKNFAPMWDITREQLAVMIYNYCCTMCGAEAVPSGSLDRSMYGDGDKIASWAADAVAYCTKVGIMKGNDKGEFCPKATATRAEFATIMERLIELFLDQKL